MCLMFALPLLWAQPADSVRWKGSVQVSGASHLPQAGEASLATRLERVARNYSLSAGLSGNWNSRLTAKNVSYSSENMRYGYAETSESKNKGGSETADIQLLIQPRKGDRISLFLQQAYTGSDQNHDASAKKFGVSDGVTQLLAEGSNASLVEKEQQSYRMQASFLHVWDSSGHSISGSMSLKNSVNSQTTVRRLEGSLYTPKTYRITPLYEQQVFVWNFQYKDPRFLDVEALHFTAGTDFSWEMNDDQYGGATMVDAEWRDSLLLKQKYLYRSGKVEPYAAAEYRIGKWELKGEERIHYFNHKLWSNLRGWDWNKGSVGHGASYVVRYLPSARHNLQWDMERVISRPDYLKLSGLLRFGSSEGVYYLGNAELQPTRTFHFNMTYTWKCVPWEVQARSGCQFRKNVAEQVLVTDKEKLPEELRERLGDAVVYSWLNTAYKRIYHCRLHGRWKQEGYSLSAWGKLNWEVSEYGSTSPSSDRNYSLGVELAKTFRGGWELSARNTYNSAKRDVYTKFNEYLSGNLRLSRQSGAWSYYAEFRELFDKRMVRTTYSSDFSDWRTESTLYYRRMLALGLCYTF
ncbi:MAG: outer membrane beta-barrel protein [Bacteroidales bacterium]|nr:outer membrane beta-barrel protein [Bacteroidales bacterium]